MSEINDHVSEINDHNFSLQALKMMQEKKGLCFQGGGTLVPAHCGALVRLDELGGLKNITHVVGTSVGSVVAAAIACGASATFIKDRIFSLNFEDFRDGSTLCVGNVGRFLKRYGWYKGDEIENVMGDILLQLTGNAEITFAQAFEKFQIMLEMPYVCVNYASTNPTKYANRWTKPNLQIKKGVRRSSSIPAIFAPDWDVSTFDESMVYVDGGITDNFPMHLLRKQGLASRDILGFKLYNTPTLSCDNAKEEIDDSPPSPPRNVYEHLISVISIMHNQTLQAHVSSEDWMLTTKINVGSMTSTNFGISQEQKEWLYNQGRTAIDNYMIELACLIENKKFSEI